MRARTRIAATAILALAVAAPVIAQFAPEREQRFADIPPHHRSFRAIEMAAALKWFEGYEDGTFQPGRTITGKQMAVVLDRLLPNGITREAFARMLENNTWVFSSQGGDPILQEGRRALNNWRYATIWDPYYKQGRCANEINQRDDFSNTLDWSGGGITPDQDQQYTELNDRVRRCECAAFQERAEELKARIGNNWQDPSVARDRAEYTAVYTQYTECFIGPPPPPPTIAPTTTSTTTTTTTEPPPLETTTTAATEGPPEEPEPAATTTAAEPEQPTTTEATEPDPPANEETTTTTTSEQGENDDR